MFGDLATRRHAPSMSRCMVATANGKSRAWRRVRYWLSPGFLLACRSSDDEPNGGVVIRNGVVAGKGHQRVFLALKRFDGYKGVLELLETKVLVVGIRHNH